MNTPLSQWSMLQISAIFENASDEQSLQVIDATFSENISATINGAPLSREDLVQRVLALRKSSKSGLCVFWHRAVDVALDPNTNRDGSFEGCYVIRGLQQQLPGMSQCTEFERRKTVAVTIRSESPDTTIESRRIVNLAFVAEDIMIDQCNLVTVGSLECVS